MMFNASKYTRWYWQIVKSAGPRMHETYTEKHHIIPRSLNGTNDPSNLVQLTAREHFLAHWLLTKMVEGQDRVKMVRAFSGMTNWKGRRGLTSAQYAKASEAASKAASLLWQTRSSEERQEFSHKCSVASIGKNSKGFYVTPWGKFATRRELEKVAPLGSHRWCKNPDFLFKKPHKYHPEWRGKTAREVGFDYEAKVNG